MTGFHLTKTFSQITFSVIRFISPIHVSFLSLFLFFFLSLIYEIHDLSTKDTHNLNMLNN